MSISTNNSEVIKQAIKAFGSERAEQEAAEKGLVVIFPKENELQLDIDSAEAYETFDKNLKVLRQMFPVAEIIETGSRSGGARKHIIVRLKQVVISNEERILLQACLGSDCTRELLSYFRVLRRDPHPTLFFEEPSFEDPLITPEKMADKSAEIVQ